MVDALGELSCLTLYYSHVELCYATLSAQLVAVAPPDNDVLLQTIISTVIHPTLSGDNKAKVDTITTVSLIGAIGM